MLGRCEDEEGGIPFRLQVKPAQNRTQAGRPRRKVPRVDLTSFRSLLTENLSANIFKFPRAKAISDQSHVRATSLISTGVQKYWAVS